MTLPRANVFCASGRNPRGHHSADYVTRRLFAPAPDGETIPISLLYRKDVAIDGTAPCLLYGYGA